MPTDRALIAATQAGLPLTASPLAEIAEAPRPGREAEDARSAARLQCCGGAYIRRIAAAAEPLCARPHRANGMTVWDVEDARSLRSAAQGRRAPISSAIAIGARAPRRIGPTTCSPWSMASAASEVEAEVAARSPRLLGGAARAGDVLYSTRILKKTGLRLKSEGEIDDVPPDPVHAPADQNVDAAQCAPRKAPGSRW